MPAKGKNRKDLKSKKAEKKKASKRREQACVPEIKANSVSPQKSADAGLEKLLDQISLGLELNELDFSSIPDDRSHAELVLEALKCRQAKSRHSVKGRQTQTEDAARVTGLIYELSREVNNSSTLKELVKNAAKVLSRCGLLRAGVLYLLSSDNGFLSPERAFGRLRNKLNGLQPLSMKDRAVKKVFASEKGARTKWLDDAGLSFNNSLSEITVPLKSGDDVVGALTAIINKDSQVSESFLSSAAAELASGIKRKYSELELKKSYEELIKREALYSTLVNTTEEAIILSDAKEKILYANPAASRLLGYTREEFESLYSYDLLNEGEKEILKKENSMRVKGKASRYELILKSKKGEPRHMLITASPVFDSDGSFYASLAALTDITEIKSAEKKLKESEEKHRLLMESIRTPVLALKEDMSILYCNEFFSEFAGKPMHELENKKLLTVLPQFKNTRYYSACKEVLKSGKAKESESIINKRYLSTRVYRTPWGILSISEDITERKTRDETLRERDELYRTLVDTAREAIILTDLNERMLFVNPMAAEMVGYELSDLIGKSVLDFIPPEERETIRSQTFKREKGETSRYETVFLHKNGTTRRVQITGSPIFDSSGRVVSTMAVITDITEITIINEISQAISSILDVKEIYKVIHEQVKRLINADNFFIAMYDKDKDEVTFPYAFQDGQIQVWSSRTGGMGMTEYVIRSGKPLLFRNASEKEASRLGIEHIGKSSRSWLGVPMIIRKEVIGVIAIQSFTEDVYYSEKHVRIMETIAAQAAQAVENAHSYSELEKKITELSVFNEISRALGATLNIGELMNVLYEQTSRVMDASSFYIGLYDEENHTVEFPLFVASDGSKTRIPPRKFENGLTEYVVLSKKPLLFSRDVVNEAKKLGIEVRIAVTSSVPQSWLGVPMIFQDKVVGVISVQSTRAENLYDNEHQRILEAIANQAAGAVSNARAYSELQQRLTELSVYNEVSRTLTSTLRFDEHMDLLYNQIKRVMDAESFYMALYDEKHDMIEFPLFIVDWGKRLDVAPKKFGNGLTERVIKSKKSLFLSENVPEKAKELGIEMRIIDQDMPQCWMGVPMISQDKVLGIMTVQSTKRANAYNQSNLRVLEALASQTASAVENSRAYAEIERKLTELSVFNEIGRALGSTLNLDELLKVIYSQITRIMEEDSFYISLYDDEKKTLEFPLYMVKGKVIDMPARPFGKGLTEYIITSRQSVVFGEDMLEREKELGISSVLYSEDDYPLSWIGVPMISHDKVIGVIGMQSLKPNIYDEDHRRILSSIANQAAQAVENARAYQELKGRFTERSVMTEISRAISSTLKINELAEVLYNQINRIMQTDSFYLALHNIDEGVLEFPYFIEKNQQMDAPSRPFGEGLTEYVIKTREPLLIQQKNFKSECKRRGIRMIVHGAPPLSWLGVPMISQNKVLGVLAVQTIENAYSYDENHMHLLSSIANQAAGAVDNARAYESLERRLTELSVFNEIGRALASTLKVDKLMEVIYTQTSRIMDAQNLYVALYDENTNMIEFPFFLDNGSRISMPSRELGNGLTDYIIRNRESLLFNDNVVKLTKNLGVDMVVKGKAPKCWLGVPMISQDKVIGVMSVQNTDRAFLYDENDKRLLQSIANQAAGAVANARAYTALERKLTELSVFNEIGRTLSSTIQLNELLKVIYSQITRIMEAEAFYIALYSEDTGMIEFPLWVENGEFKEVSARKFGKGMTEYVISTRKPLLLGENMENEEKELGIESYKFGEQSYSWLGAPMISHDKVLGIISIQSTKKSIYDEGHKKLLESIASQAAGAVANARAYKVVEQRGEELRSLLKTSSDLSSTLDISEIAYIIAERASDLIPANGCTFYRFNNQQKKLIPLASTVIEEYDQRMSYEVPLGEGATGRAALERKPVIANNLHLDSKAPRIPGTKELPTCILAAPLIARNELLGAMTLLRLSEQEFKDHDLQLFTLFSRQAADAFANSLFFSELKQLNEDMERRNAERQALLETSTAVSATLDENQIVQLISEKATDFLQADGCTYYQYDEVAKELVPKTSTVVEGKKQILSHRIKLDEGVTGRAASQKKAILANNVHLDPKASRIPGTKDLPTCLMSIPLLARGDLLGVMTLLRLSEKEFTQHDLELFNLFARQVTDSLANSRLFGKLRQLNKDLQHRSDELSSLFNTSTELSSILDDGQLGSLIAKRAKELVSSDGCTFYTFDQESNMLIPVSSTLVDEHGELMAYKVPLGEGITGKAALEKRPILANLVHLDPLAKSVPGTKERPMCMLATPLIARGELVGCMTLVRLSEHGFEEHDLQLFTLFGRQAAEVFSNSRLFGKLKELNENLEGIVKDRTAELERASVELEKVHQDYTERVRMRLAAIAPIMEKISIGDFSQNIPLPDSEDEFTELFVGLNLMIDDLRFMFEENRRRSEESRRRSEELSALLNTSTALASSLYEDEVYKLVTENATSLINADRCTIYKFSSGTNELIPQTTTEKDNPEPIMNFNISLGVGVVGKCGLERSPQLANNVHRDTDSAGTAGQKQTPTCIMAAPLIVQRELLGVMELVRLSEEVFTEHDMELFLLFSRQVAETTANARLFGKLKDLNENLELMVNQRTKELEESNRKTAAFARELEEVIYVTSHDLKTPLRAISGFSQFLYEDYREKIDPEGRLYLTRLIDAAKRMEKLLDDLLNISAITRKERTFDRIPSGDIIKEAIKLLNPEENVDIVYDPDLLPTIFCDRSKMTEVFYNLISNGLKFNDKPRKKVTINARDVEGFHEFTVEDNGIGIEKRHYERIFKIFQRLHLRENYEGTGVGLSMVKRVLEEHNGRIWVESQIGVGTIFHFTLPHHKEDERDETDNSERSM